MHRNLGFAEPQGEIPLYSKDVQCSCNIHTAQKKEKDEAAKCILVSSYEK